MSTTPDRAGNHTPDWATASGRVEWLVDTRFQGNRSAMARAVGFSHAIISEVVRGGRTPGPRLRGAIADRLGVDPVWLNTGAGQPFVPGPPVHVEDGLFVSPTPLPGLPPVISDPTRGGRAGPPVVAPSPTRYWLKLTSADPLVRVSGARFFPDDRLLLEADPAAFPPPAMLFERLCVVRTPASGGVPRLATLTFYPDDPGDGPARLEADFHDGAAADGGIVEDVYRRYPGGEIRHVRRPVREVTVKGRTRVVPAGRSASAPPVVAYETVAAVWLQVLYRPPG